MRDQDVERAFRRERWKVLAIDFKTGAPIVLALLFALAFACAWIWSPRQFVAEDQGVVEAIRYVQREDGPPWRRVRVKLDSNGYADAYLPRAILYEPGMRVGVRITERTWFPGSRTYELTRVLVDQ